MTVSKAEEAVPPSFQITSTIRYAPELPSLPQFPATYPQPHSSPFYLIRYHYDRLLEAAGDFQWDKAIARLQKHSSIEANVEALSTRLSSFVPDSTRPWRLRLMLDHEGAYTVETTPTAPLFEHVLLISEPTPPQSRPTFSSLLAPEASSDSEPWRLKLDSQPTVPSAFTRHKTSQRDMYMAARKRVDIKSPREPVEVLVYNPQGETMEGSITAVYFKRRGHTQSKTVDGEPDWVTPPLSCGGNGGTSRRYALESGLCVEEVVRVDELVDGETVWLSNGLRGFMEASFERG